MLRKEGFLEEVQLRKGGFLEEVQKWSLWLYWKKGGLKGKRRRCSARVLVSCWGLRGWVSMTVAYCCCARRAGRRARRTPIDKRRRTRSGEQSGHIEFDWVLMCFCTVWTKAKREWHMGRKDSTDTWLRLGGGTGWAW